MTCIVEIGLGGMTCIPSFMNIGKGVEGMLRFHLSSLKDFNVGITAGRNLRCAPLKWSHVELYTNQVP
jgi:hypothetical protein